MKLILLITLFTSFAIGAKKTPSKFKKRKPASANDLKINYMPSSEASFQFKIAINPFGNYILIKPKRSDQTYSYDCSIDSNWTSWRCSAPCDTGSIKVEFPTGDFKQVSIPPFKVKLRFCDGSESASDPELETKKQTSFSFRRR